MRTTRGYSFYSSRTQERDSADSKYKFQSTIQHSPTRLMLYRRGYGSTECELLRGMECVGVSGETEVLVFFFSPKFNQVVNYVDGCFRFRLLTQCDTFCGVTRWKMYLDEIPAHKNCTYVISYSFCRRS